MPLIRAVLVVVFVALGGLRVEGAMATTLAKGTVTLTATQEGNGDYAPAKLVVRTLTVN